MLSEGWALDYLPLEWRAQRCSCPSLGPAGLQGGRWPWRSQKLRAQGPGPPPSGSQMCWHLASGTVGSGLTLVWGLHPGDVSFYLQQGLGE